MLSDGSVRARHRTCQTAPVAPCRLLGAFAAARHGRAQAAHAHAPAHAHAREQPFTQGLLSTRRLRSAGRAAAGECGRPGLNPHCTPSLGGSSSVAHRGLATAGTASAFCGQPASTRLWAARCAECCARARFERRFAQAWAQEEEAGARHPRALEKAGHRGTLGGAAARTCSCRPKRRRFGSASAKSA